MGTPKKTHMMVFRANEVDQLRLLLLDRLPITPVIIYTIGNKSHMLAPRWQRDSQIPFPFGFWVCFVGVVATFRGIFGALCAFQGIEFRVLGCRSCRVAGMGGWGVSGFRGFGVAGFRGFGWLVAGGCSGVRTTDWFVTVRGGRDHRVQGGSFECFSCSVGGNNKRG